MYVWARGTPLAVLIYKQYVLWGTSIETKTSQSQIASLIHFLWL